MLNLLSKSPFYLRAAILLVGICFFVYILYIGQEILIPLTFSAILSILLSPIVNFLEAKKVPRVWAILIPLVVAIFIILCISGALLSEAGLFTKALPMLERKAHYFLDQLIPWLSDNFNIDGGRINMMVTNARNDIFNESSKLIGEVLFLITNAFLVSLLIPIYVFMMLYYKTLVLEFIRQFFDIKDHIRVGEIIIETKSIVKNYLVGLLIETTAITLVYTITLWAFGIKYILLFGVIGALLNIIPYVGGLISIAFYMLLAFLTKESLSSTLLIMAAGTVIQFIDKHYIIPFFVASKVNVNALVSVIMILIGGALWGVSGMFLSIPFTGIMKVIFDRVPIMKPWGVLLGDKMPDHVKFNLVHKNTGKPVKKSK
jgi:predicted PurR-regulated permease PerM